MNRSAAEIRYPWPQAPEGSTPIEVARGILWFRFPLPMRLDHINVYVLDDGDSWTVVDTGFFNPRGRSLWQEVLNGPLAGKPVRRVVVTHHHPDHIGMAGWFQKEHGAELVTSRTAWLLARMLTLDVQDRPTEESLTYFQRAGMHPEILEERRNERPMNYSDMVAPMPLGFIRIQEGETIDMGGRTWDIRFGNGHAPDHATFWSQDGEVVLCGDQLLASISPNLGVYATEPEADPVGEWLESCERFMPFATDAQVVLPGHKLPYTGLPRRVSQLIDNHHSALERLRKFLTEPRTAVECFPPLYMKSIGAGEYGLAMVEAVGHLNHLYKEGLVTRRLGKDGAWLWQIKGNQGGPES